MKYAVLTMDIEDWYHLDYLRNRKCDQTYSMLDGISKYKEIIDFYEIPSTFFVLGELVSPLKTMLKTLNLRGHEIASHGRNHVRPMVMDVREFKKEVQQCKKELEDVTGNEILGYRAPCFSIDRERLDFLQNVGFKYDSSRILFEAHSLYNILSMDGYEKLSNNIFRSKDFFEFQVSTLKVGKKHIPISGGGYLRIFPWMVMKKMIKSYLKIEDLYVLYIHPFELSSKADPIFPLGTKLVNRIRFSLGRPTVAGKLCSLINMLKKDGFQFTTFSFFRERILQQTK